MVVFCCLCPPLGQTDSGRSKNISFPTANHESVSRTVEGASSKMELAGVVPNRVSHQHIAPAALPTDPLSSWSPSHRSPFVMDKQGSREQIPRMNSVRTIISSKGLEFQRTSQQQLRPKVTCLVVRPDFRIAAATTWKYPLAQAALIPSTPLLSLGDQRKQNKPDQHTKENACNRI